MVAVFISLPIRGAASSIERKRKLALRPLGIFFPPPAENVEHPIRNVDGPEAFAVLLVHPEKLPAGGQVIIDNIEDFAVDAGLQTRQNDGFGAIVNIG